MRNQASLSPPPYSADAPGMRTKDLVLVQGLRDTRETLDRWRAAPLGVLSSWLGLSVAVAVCLLLAVWAVAGMTAPDPSGLDLPGVTRQARAADLGPIFLGNGLVLALHALACVAGFMAGSSMPLTAQHHNGLWRRVHELAGPFAILFVAGATLFSLTTQAYVLGSFASTLSAQLGLSPAELIVGLLPHALPELAALFLPLAAWILASRRGRWHELLAATFATVAIAVPVLVAAALVELWVTPDLIRSLAS